MSAEPIEAEKMSRILQALGVDLRWEEVKSMYDNWRPISTLLFQYCDEAGIHRFAELFQFKNCFMEKCKKELIDYIEEFPQFEGNTLEEIYDKMVHAVQAYNAINDSEDKILYVNCITD